MTAWLTALLLLTTQGSRQEVNAWGTAGLNGSVVRGERTPIRVEIDNSNHSRELVLTLAWAESGPSQSSLSSARSLSGRRGPAHRMAFSMAAGSHKVLYATLIAPPLDGMSVWAFVENSDGKTLAITELAPRLVPPGYRLIATVGGDRPDGMDLPGVEIARLRPSDLPEEWQGYAGLDALVWLDGSVADLRTPAQLDALKTWVSTGGRLIVARAHGIEG